MIHIFSHFFLFFFIVYYNGVLFLKVSNYNYLRFDKFEISFFGIIVTGLVAQTINFFVPLNSYIIIFNTILILIFIILDKKIKLKLEIKKIDFFYIFLFLLIILNIYGSKFSDDLDHYHYGYINNSDNSNYIIGLGHLHAMYAYSSIWLITHSYFNFDYSRLQDIHVLNGLIFFIFLSIFYKEIKSSLIKKENNIYIPILFSILIFILLKYTRLKEFGIDRAPFLILYFLILFYLKNFFLNDEKNNIDTKIILLIYICIFLFYIKITFFFACLIPLYYIIKHKNFRIFISKPFIPIYIFVLSYLIKNFIISGCFIFPIGFTCLESISWNMKEIAEEQYIISEILNKSWWLYKGTLTDLEYIKNFNWFETWFIRSKIEFLEFFLTSILTIIFTILSFHKSNIRNNNFLIKKISEIFKIFSIIFSIQVVLFFFKLPVIRMSHYLFIFFSILILIIFFYKFKLFAKKKVLFSIIFIALTFNFTKNFTRISENKFVNSPYESKPHTSEQTKLKLNKFEYYKGWYGNYPTSNVVLGDSYEHKRILIFDMIYKVN